ncbi:Tautomerase/MIF [Astrocystis sublimbata]|nr:Tautomerase/MIF [Astrocystis sublimbata]
MLASSMHNPSRDTSFGAAGTRHADSPMSRQQQHSQSQPQQQQQQQQQQPAGPSFAQRKARQSRPSNGVLVEGSNVTRSIDRPLPGDVVGRRKQQPPADAIRKQSAYFESEFAEPTRSDDPARTRILNEAMVSAELKTNVIVHDEFALITDLATHLSNRYQRPMSSIIVTVQHGLCMMFGSTFDPAYTLTIHALPDLLQPATNRRNANLTQRHLHETLGVVPVRGLVRFEATHEENVAIGGKTLGAEMEGVSRDHTERKPGAPRKPSRSGRGLMKGVKSLSSFRSHSVIDLSDKVPTPPPSNSGESPRIQTIPEVPPTPPDEERTATTTGQMGEQKTPPKSAPRRKSHRFALFGSRHAPDK